MGLPDVVRRTEDLLRLLDGVLCLASHEQGGQGNVLVVVFVARKPRAKLVVVYRRGVERLDRSVNTGVSLGRGLTWGWDTASGNSNSQL